MLAREKWSLAKNLLAKNQWNAVTEIEDRASLSVVSLCPLRRSLEGLVTCRFLSSTTSPWNRD